MSRIQVNSIVNKTDTAGPELTFGATVPSTAVFNVQSGVNITGVVTASNFSGNGSALTGLSIATKAKAIALKKIISFDEYRS